MIRDDECHGGGIKEDDYIKAIVFQIFYVIKIEAKRAILYTWNQTKVESFHDHSFCIRIRYEWEFKANSPLLIESYN